MSFGKYHINGFRFFGLAIIFTGILWTITDIGLWTNNAIDMLMRIYPSEITAGFITSQRIYGEIAVFIGSVLLSVERKEGKLS